MANGSGSLRWRILGFSCPNSSRLLPTFVSQPSSPSGPEVTSSRKFQTMEGVAAYFENTYPVSLIRQDRRKLCKDLR